MRTIYAMKATRRKSIRYAGFTLRRIPRTGGREAWQVERWDGDTGRHCRRAFKTRAEAEGWADRQRAELDAIGRQAHQLTDPQRADAVKALAILSGAATLEAAAACWMRYYRPPTGAATFRALVGLYLADAAARNLRQRSLQDLRSRLSRPFPDFGDVPAAALDAATLDGWLDAQALTPANRRNYRTVFHGVFTWATEKGHTPDNPAAGLRRVKVETGMPAIFTPAEVEAIMRAAEATEPRAVPYLALAFFAGIRPAELVRLTWHDVDLAAGIVTVRPEHAKKRRSRIIALAVNARRWLTAYRPQGAAAGAGIVSSEMTLRRLMREVRKASGLRTWPPDVARHCFGSFHLALHGDISRTCLDMGHTGPGVLFNHYRNLATKEQAAAFFAIDPATEQAGKVLTFRAAG